MLPEPSSNYRTRPAVTNYLVAFLLYLGAAGMGLEMALWSQFVPLVWPAAGVALAIVILGGIRLLPVVFLGAAVARLLEGAGAGDAFLFGLAYAFIAYLTFFIFKKRATFRCSLERIIDVSWLLGIAVLALPLLSALITSWTISLYSPGVGPGLVPLIGIRWMADAIGILVVAPFILVWYSRTRINWKNNQTVEVLVWLAVLIAAGALVFRNWAPTDTLRYPMELAMFPIMAWAAIRFGQRGVTTGNLIVALMAVWELRDVIGPDATNTISQPPGYLWAFVGILSTTSLFLAATWTEIRKREDMHKGNEERLRAFVQALPDLALVFKENGTCTEIFAPANSSFRERMDFFKGRQLQSIYPEDLAQTFQMTIREVLDTRKLAIIRYAISLDGEDRVYEGRFVPIELIEDSDPEVMVVSYDLTKEQHFQNRLLKRDRLLKTLTDAEGILLIERLFHRGINGAMDCVGKGIPLDLVQLYRIHRTGSERIECSHQWSRDRTDGALEYALKVDHLNGMLDGWKTHLKSLQPILLDTSTSNQTGRRLLSEWGMQSLLIFGLFPSGGDPGFLVFGSRAERVNEDSNSLSVLASVARSIQAYMETHLSKLELEQARKKAEEANRAKSEFLATISHEIRTPMNAILGFSDLLNQTVVNKKQQEYIRIIHKSGKDLLNLISNILDFSKLESGGIQVEHASFCLQDTLRTVVQIVNWQAREKNLDLRTNVTGDSNQCYLGDSHRIRQILLNLLTNAVKFTRSGHVSLEASVARQEGKYHIVSFTVTDTGIGIPEGQFRKLFDPFRQLDSSSTREYGGSGLGLSIALKLVDNMGGSISLESVLRKGSIFRVNIPLEADPQDAVASVRPFSHENKDKLTISACPLRVLVVEDDAFNTRITCNILEEIGYDIETATDGIEALRTLSEIAFDVVLMDMHMTKLDGLETIRRIRMGQCGASVKDIPVIAFSSLDIDEEEQRVLAGGANYFLSKPLYPEKVQNLLEKVFRHRSSRKA